MDIPEIRIDPITKERVVFSPGRFSRPHDVESAAIETDLPVQQDHACPFCPGNEHKTPASLKTHNPHSSILYYSDGNGSWTTRVFPNKFPIFNLEGSLDHRVNGIYESMGAYGAHEVIVESRHHEADIHSMPEEWVFRMLLAYQERAKDLRGNKNLKYVSIFRNDGKEAGASLSHPHSQLIAEPTIPTHHQNLFANLSAFQQQYSSCAFCSLIKYEIKDARRVVCQNDDYLAFTPYASKYPYTVNIIPLQHQPWFEESTKENLKNLTSILKDVMGALHRGLRDPPYNWYLRNAPVNTGLEDFLQQNWHVKLTIIPRTSTQAGYEQDTHNAVNTVLPETAAKDLREMIKLLQEEKREKELAPVGG
ncbi:MAG: DUF4921 family protein [Nanoarchaeota archaeon]